MALLRIESPRLVLLPIQFSDVNDMLRCVRESINDLTIFLPWAVPEYNLKHAQAFLQDAVADNVSGKVHTLVIRTKTGNFLGLAELRPQPDPSGRIVPAFELGFWVRTPDTRKGFATETAQALAQYAITQMGAKRVAFSSHSENKGSIRVAEKAGFTAEARLKNTRKNTDETLADTLIFAKTN